jgi:hypothetical protein
MIGFDNIAYFDSSEDREWFIANVDGIPAVTMTRLSPVTRDDVEMFPLQLDFEEEQPRLRLVDTSNVPF